MTLPDPGTPPSNGANSFAYFSRSFRNAVVLGCTEASTLIICLMVGMLVRFKLKGDIVFDSWMWYLVAAWVIGAYVARLLPGWGLGPVEELRRTTLVLAGVFFGTIAMLFWGKAAQETSRLTLTAGFLLSIVFIPFARLQVKRLLIRHKVWGIPTAIYANKSNGGAIVDALFEESGLGYVPTFAFSNDTGEMSGVPIVGNTDQSTQKAFIAIVHLPEIPRDRIAHMLDGPLSSYRRVVVIPDLLDTPSLWVKPRDLVGMLGLEISMNLLDPVSRVAKRTFDLIIVLLTAPLWVPLSIVLGLLTWMTDLKNPFFVQERVGHHHHRFRTFKFRTMHPEAEKILAQKLDEDPALRAEWSANFKLRSDPRITPIGRFLRRTSLDELPQLVNVLRGEMSIVGPRPLPTYHFDELPERTQSLRARVRPGITGLWQVSGRSESGHLGMTKWDTYYVRNWSIWLDIVIIIRTIRAVTSGRGAF